MLDRVRLRGIVRLYVHEPETDTPTLTLPHVKQWGRG
jgi:hypothetical protein